MKETKLVNFLKYKEIPLGIKWEWDEKTKGLTYKAYVMFYKESKFSDLKFENFFQYVKH